MERILRLEPLLPQSPASQFTSSRVLDLAAPRSSDVRVAHRKDEGVGMRELEPEKKSLPPSRRSCQATWHVKPRSSLGTVLLNDAIALASGPVQLLAIENSDGAVLVFNDVI